MTDERTTDDDRLCLAHLVHCWSVLWPQLFKGCLRTVRVSVPQDLRFQILFVTVLCWDCSQVFFFSFFHFFICFLNFSSCSNIWLCISFGSSVKSWNFLSRRAISFSSKTQLELNYWICFRVLYIFVVIVHSPSSLFFNVELSVSPLNVIVVHITIENR